MTIPTGTVYYQGVAVAGTGGGGGGTTTSGGGGSATGTLPEGYMHYSTPYGTGVYAIGSQPAGSTPTGYGGGSNYQTWAAEQASKMALLTGQTTTAGTTAQTATQDTPLLASGINLLSQPNAQPAIASPLSFTPVGLQQPIGQNADGSYIYASSVSAPTQTNLPLAPVQAPLDWSSLTGVQMGIMPARAEGTGWTKSGYFGYTEPPKDEKETTGATKAAAPTETTPIDSSIIPFGGDIYERFSGGKFEYISGKTGEVLFTSGKSAIQNPQQAAQYASIGAKEIYEAPPSYNKFGKPMGLVKTPLGDLPPPEAGYYLYGEKMVDGKRVQFAVAPMIPTAGGQMVGGEQYQKVEGVAGLLNLSGATTRQEAGGVSQPIGTKGYWSETPAEGSLFAAARGKISEAGSLFWQAGEPPTATATATKASDRTWNTGYAEGQTLWERAMAGRETTTTTPLATPFEPARAPYTQEYSNIMQVQASIDTSRVNIASQKAQLAEWKASGQYAAGDLAEAERVIAKNEAGISDAEKSLDKYRDVVKFQAQFNREMKEIQSEGWMDNPKFQKKMPDGSIYYGDYTPEEQLEIAKYENKRSQKAYDIGVAALPFIAANYDNPQAVAFQKSLLQQQAALQENSASIAAYQKQLAPTQSAEWGGMELTTYKPQESFTGKYLREFDEQPKWGGIAGIIQEGSRGIMGVGLGAAENLVVIPAKHLWGMSGGAVIGQTQATLEYIPQAFSSNENVRGSAWMNYYQKMWERHPLGYSLQRPAEATSTALAVGAIVAPPIIGASGLMGAGLQMPQLTPTLAKGIATTGTAEISSTLASQGLLRGTGTVLGTAIRTLPAGVGLAGGTIARAAFNPVYDKAGALTGYAVSPKGLSTGFLSARSAVEAGSVLSGAGWDIGQVKNVFKPSEFGMEVGMILGAGALGEGMREQYVSKRTEPRTGIDQYPSKTTATPTGQKTIGQVYGETTAGQDVYWKPRFVWESATGATKRVVPVGAQAAGEFIATVETVQGAKPMVEVNPMVQTQADIAAAKAATATDATATHQISKGYLRPFGETTTQTFYQEAYGQTPKIFGEMQARTGEAPVFQRTIQDTTYRPEITWGAGEGQSVFTGWTNLQTGKFVPYAGLSMALAPSGKMEITEGWTPTEIREYTPPSEQYIVSREATIAPTGEGVVGLYEESMPIEQWSALLKFVKGSKEPWLTKQVGMEQTVGRTLLRNVETGSSVVDTTTGLVGRPTKGIAESDIFQIMGGKSTIGQRSLYDLTVWGIPESGQFRPEIRWGAGEGASRYMGKTDYTTGKFHPYEEPFLGLESAGVRPSMEYVEPYKPAPLTSAEDIYMMNLQARAAASPTVNLMTPHEFEGSLSAALRTTLEPPPQTPPTGAAAGTGAAGAETGAGGTRTSGGLLMKTEQIPAAGTGEVVMSQAMEQLLKQPMISPSMLEAAIPAPALQMVSPTAGSTQTFSMSGILKTATAPLDQKLVVRGGEMQMILRQDGLLKFAQPTQQIIRPTTIQVEKQIQAEIPIERVAFKGRQDIIVKTEQIMRPQEQLIRVAAPQLQITRISEIARVAEPTAKITTRTDLTTRLTNVPPPPPPPPPVGIGIGGIGGVPPLLPRGGGGGAGIGGGMGGRGLGGFSKSGVRSMYSDLLSVMQSEVKYGKGTSPSLIKRPSAWKYESNVFGRVPTVEQLEDTGRGKSKKTKVIKRASPFKLSMKRWW